MKQRYPEGDSKDSIIAQEKLGKNVNSSRNNYWRMLKVLRNKYPALEKSYNDIPIEERCNGYDRLYLTILRHVMLTWYDIDNPSKNIDWKNMSYLLDEQE